MIRPMAESDLSRAAELVKRYFSVPWSEQSLRESLAKPEYLFLVLEEAGRIVGYGGMLLILDEGDITNIVVDEAWRGRGLGRELTEGLLEAGRKRGAHAFTLEVRVGNERAVRLYEGLGFCPEGVRKGFYDKPKEDALIMWKRETQP